MPDFSFEQRYPGPVIGIDEAGRGPWAGPVVAAAVYCIPDALDTALCARIKDSKKMTALQRDAVYDIVSVHTGMHWSIGVAQAAEIDQLNIRQANFLAMHRACDSLALTPQTLLIDGNDSLPDPPCTVVTIVKGDIQSISIAAASIIAKVTRDRLMMTLHQEFPQYDWANNKGYGTTSHQQALRQYGPCVHHRRSFAPIKQLYTLVLD